MMPHHTCSDLPSEVLQCAGRSSVEVYSYTVIRMSEGSLVRTINDYLPT